MYPKFVLVSRPDTPLVGTFVYGLVWNHKDLVDALPGYVKVHGGGWYDIEFDYFTSLWFTCASTTFTM